MTTESGTNRPVNCLLRDFHQHHANPDDSLPNKRAQPCCNRGRFLRSGLGSPNYRRSKIRRIGLLVCESIAAPFLLWLFRFGLRRLLFEPQFASAAKGPGQSKQRFLRSHPRRIKGNLACLAVRSASIIMTVSHGAVPFTRRAVLCVRDLRRRPSKASAEGLVVFCTLHFKRSCTGLSSRIGSRGASQKGGEIY